MKRTILTGLALLLGSSLLMAQTTATNFNVADCAGTTHDLFANLDSGKVVVLVWVMPCATCIGPTKSANSTALSYSATNPGKVINWVADDYANTTCNTLTSWLNTNAIKPHATFKNTAINMLNYGTTGMPKTVVLGGTNHAVYFNENNTVNVTLLREAIDSALAANVVPEDTTTVPVDTTNTGIGNYAKGKTPFKVYPVIAGSELNLAFDASPGSQYRVEIINAVGMLVSSEELQTAAAGNNHRITLKDEWPDGLYYVKLLTGDRTQAARFVISR